MSFVEYCRGNSYLVDFRRILQLYNDNNLSKSKYRNKITQKGVTMDTESYAIDPIVDN